MIEQKPKTTGTKQRDLLVTTNTWGMDAAFTGHSVELAHSGHISHLSHIFSPTQPPFCGGRSSHRPAPKRTGRCLHKGSSSSFPRHLISFMKPQQLLVRQCRARPLSSAVAAPSLHTQLPYRSPGCELPKELQAQPNPIAELI